MNLSLAFHLFSLVAFVWLLILLQRAMKRERFNHELWQKMAGREAGKVLVYWPQGFLKEFCHNLGISYSYLDDKPGIQQPCRIEPKPLVELFCRGGIDLIRYQSASGKPIVEIHMANLPADAKDWQSKVSAALGHSCEVVFRRSQSEEA